MDPDLPLRNAGRIKNTRREMRVLYALLAASVVVALAFFENQASHLERSDRAQDKLGAEVVQANREGCERTNVLRLNQATIIQEQIDATELSLKNLKNLESFRVQIEEGQRSRKRAIAGLLRSVNGAAVPGKPYEVDCVKAYP